MIFFILCGIVLVASLIISIREDYPGIFLGGFFSAVILLMFTVVLGGVGVNQTVTTDTVSIFPLNGNYVTLSDDNYFVQTDKGIVSIPVIEAKIVNGSPRLEYKTFRGEGTWTVFDKGTETTIYTNTGVAVASGS